MLYLLVLLVGIAGGWAFYKHRKDLKARAVAAEQALKDAVKTEASKL